MYQRDAEHIPRRSPALRPTDNSPSRRHWTRRSLTHMPYSVRYPHSITRPRACQEGMQNFEIAARIFCRGDCKVKNTCNKKPFLVIVRLNRRRH